MTLELKIDYRLGGIPQYKVVEESDNFMQVPDEIRKCVVFVCYNSTTGMKLAGTAFLIGVQLETYNLASSYFVTAKHVIDGIREKSIDQSVYLRINLKDTGFKLIKTPIGKWLSHPHEPNIDVSVFNWAPSYEIFDYLYIPLDMAATQELIKKENIGVGDEVFLTGLFANHYGSQRNIPVIRAGNIATMPEEKVHTEKLGDIDAYLIEVRSISGLSGSPVFAYLGGIRKVGNSMNLRKGPLFYLLGLMHGHFELSKLEIDTFEYDTLTNVQINMGIAIVVPVWKILEVINQEEFKNRRDLALKQAKEKISPVLDSGTKSIESN